MFCADFCLYLVGFSFSKVIKKNCVMRVLKVIGIILLVLIGLFLLLGIFAPNEIRTERTAVFPAPPSVVYNTISDLKTWEEWSVWQEMDPTTEVTYGENAAGAGAYYTWVGEKTGSGRVTIVSVEPNEKIDVEVSFDGMGTAETPFKLEPAPEGTKVTWSFFTEIPYPWNALSLFQPGAAAIDKDYDRSFELLKKYLEDKTAGTSTAPMIQEKDMPDRHFVAIRNHITTAQIAETFGRDFGRISRFLQENKVEMAGMPCGLYFNWDEATDEMDMASAIPVAEPLPVEGDMELITLPASKTLIVDHYGGYEDLMHSYNAAQAYLTAHHLEASQPMYEEYLTDPGAEPDTSKWLTRIYYPLQ